MVGFRVLLGLVYGQWFCMELGLEEDVALVGWQMGDYKYRVSSR